MKVLAIGATGQYAGLVVLALASRGLAVRALVHDPAKAGRVRDLGADETVAGICAIARASTPPWRELTVSFISHPPSRRTPQSWGSAW